MRNVRRIDPESRPIFITLVTSGRKPLLAGIENLVISVMAELRIELGYRVYSHVILPDHLHAIVDGAIPIGEFVRSLKLRVARRSALGRLWQPRFHDHVIRDEKDLFNHLDYVHFNPVKHGFATTPEAHPFSSYQRYQARNWYPPEWGHSWPDAIAKWDLE